MRYGAYTALDRIKLARGTAGGLELQRIDGRWQVPSLWNAPADAEKIRRLLQAVMRLTGEVRGNSKELFDDFGITDTQAVHVTLMEGTKERLHLLISAVPAGLRQLFVRQAEGVTVFLCESDLWSTLGIAGDPATSQPGAEAWTDLVVTHFES